jgi:hypothetical protein
VRINLPHRRHLGLYHAYHARSDVTLLTFDTLMGRNPPRAVMDVHLMACAAEYRSVCGGNARHSNYAHGKYTRKEQPPAHGPFHQWYSNC